MNKWQASFKCYLKEIKNLVSCPHDIYQTLYVVTLDRLAAFCQAISLSETMPMNSHDLFEKQLQLSVATLKLRRGLFFPRNEDIEIIAAEEPQWTYALFSAALLRNMNQTVLQENIEDRNVFITDVVKRIIPQNAMGWLTKNTFLYELWWQAILHRQNDISSVIEKSMALLDKNHFATPILPKTDKDNCIDSFMSWLVNIAELKPDSLFQTKKGLFVSHLIVNDFISEQKNITESSFIDQLSQSNILIKDQMNAYHSFSPKKFEDRRIIQGIILNNDVIPAILQNAPFNHEYQENTIL